MIQASGSSGFSRGGSQGRALSGAAWLEFLRVLWRCSFAQLRIDGFSGPAFQVLLDSVVAALHDDVVQLLLKPCAPDQLRPPPPPRPKKRRKNKTSYVFARSPQGADDDLQKCAFQHYQPKTSLKHYAGCRLSSLTSMGLLRIPCLHRGCFQGQVRTDSVLDFPSSALCVAEFQT